MTTFETFAVDGTDPFKNSGRKAAELPQEYIAAVKASSETSKQMVRVKDEAEAKDVIKILHRVGTSLGGSVRTRIVDAPVTDRNGKKTGKTTPAVAFYLGERITQNRKPKGEASAESVETVETDDE